MIQTSLDDLFGAGQARNIERVGDAIAGHVRDFVGENRQWHAQELRDYIAERLGRPTAPASAGRIMRDLRQRGLINYRVVDRRGSRYERLPNTEGSK